MMGSIHIAAVCAIKHLATDVTLRGICVYIQGSVHIPAMCAIKDSRIKVT
jgi:hypothetical protein